MDRTDESNQKLPKDFGKDTILVNEETEDVTVKPGEVDDDSDGMEEKDYLGKSNNKNRED
jgi:hypothetical protein